MNKQVYIIVVTDLDGTLLDHYTYSFNPARKALKILNDHNIPLIFCSSKTSKEMIMWRERLKNQHPFIVENGGAVYIPKGYFFSLPKNNKNIFRNNFNLFVLSRPSSDIIRIIEKIKKEYPCEIRYLSEMTPAEISKNTGLPLIQARYAKARNYNEPCVVHDIKGTETKLFLQAIHREGIRWTQGDRFIHFMSGSDKGKAVQWIIRLYKKNNPERKIISIGIGDSLNDLPMLKAVDYPCIVQKYNGRYNPELRDNDFYRAGKSGPEGWQRAIMHCLTQLRVITK
ncbi:MAG: HAD-IIB family hydrolase [Patescibacteria group bacterium]|nr:HAD-IIB family hydrolase [Patescibacteria group bacterium]